ncbi:MAG: His-Xaa-Ser system radical SAM maturase HxsB [Desulfovibrionaceae bacterium]
MRRLLPFSFLRLDEETVLLVNECGDFTFLSPDQFKRLTGPALQDDDELPPSLESRHFLAEGDLALPLELMATKYRTRKGFLRNFTALHMMVVTVRCNQRCKYCQVSSEDEQAHTFDMSPDVAQKIVECIFQSPGEDIKIEFQGGEPVLNWKAVTTAIEYAEALNRQHHKRVEFVICTNLTIIKPEQLEYLRDHQVAISTSLDGPREIHDANRRLRTGGGTYDLFLEHLDLARKICGDRVSALMTTTQANLHALRDVVDEYLRQGFPGIFFRSLNPFGFAATDKAALGYPPEAFTRAFIDGLDYILSLNFKGTPFVEYFTALLLQRILTPFPTGFVDLQSPAGTGICGVIYDYNGDVYPSDESRMLARMGDASFRMGNVFTNTYQEIFLGETLRHLVSNSCVETLPGCADCAYSIYCGADPVRNYLEVRDIVGHRPTSGLCRIHKGLFNHLFRTIRRADENVLDLFWAWATGRDLAEVQA